MGGRLRTSGGGKYPAFGAAPPGIPCGGRSAFLLLRVLLRLLGASYRLRFCPAGLHRVGWRYCGAAALPRTLFPSPRSQAG